MENSNKSNTDHKDFTLQTIKNLLDGIRICSEYNPYFHNYGLTKEEIGYVIEEVKELTENRQLEESLKKLFYKYRNDIRLETLSKNSSLSISLIKIILHETRLRKFDTSKAWNEQPLEA